MQERSDNALYSTLVLHLSHLIYSESNKIKPDDYRLTVNYRSVCSLTDACSMFLLKKEPCLSCSKNHLLQRCNKELSETGSPDYRNKDRFKTVSATVGLLMFDCIALEILSLWYHFLPTSS